MSKDYAYINAKKVRNVWTLWRERWKATAKVPVSRSFPGAWHDHKYDYYFGVSAAAKTRSEAMQACEELVLMVHEENKAVIEEEKRKMREDYAHKSVRLD